MSRPWSQGGHVPGLADDWATLFRNYAVGAVVVALILWGAGFRCAKYLDSRPDPAIAGEQRHAQAVRDSIRDLRVVKDSLAITLVVLHARLAVDSAQAAALHIANERRDAGLVIDTSAASIALLPAEEPGSSSARLEPIAGDTVRYADLQRPNDGRHYTVPLFFAENYLGIRAERNSLLVLAHDQHDVIDGLMAKAGVADSMIARYESLDSTNQRMVAQLERERHPWCQWKCGAVGTLVVLGAVAYGVHQIHGLRP